MCLCQDICQAFVHGSCSLRAGTRYRYDSSVEGGARPRISDPTSQISLKLLMNVTKGPLDAPRAPEFFFEDPKGGGGGGTPMARKARFEKVH